MIGKNHNESFCWRTDLNILGNNVDGWLVFTLIADSFPLFLFWIVWVGLSYFFRLFDSWRHYFFLFLINYHNSDDKNNQNYVHQTIMAESRAKRLFFWWDLLNIAQEVKLIVLNKGIHFYFILISLNFCHHLVLVLRGDFVIYECST